MADHLLATVASTAGVSLVAAVTTDLVSEVRRRHDLSPTATAAIGRLVTGAILLAAHAGPHERISLNISGSGPIGALAADAWLLDDGTIGARGYARNPHVDLPVNALGKFDVAGALGTGSLQVTTSYEVGQPYVGVVPLQTGEIAEDLAAYLLHSEQIPSIVALGVLADPSGVVAAGGILARVLPGASEQQIASLERRAAAMPAVTSTIARYPDARRLLAQLLGDEAIADVGITAVTFACTCTRAKAETLLRGLGSDELARLRSQREQTEATCEFCRHRYVFTRAQIEALIRDST